MKRYLPLIKRFFNRKQKFSLLIVFTFLFFNFSCIEQFTPKLDAFNSSQLLVVEGQITDEAGPFRVRLTNSVSVYSDPNILNLDQPVYGADVQIFDDKGNQFQLYYDTEGWYETEGKNLKGIVGNTYTLNITLEDGTQYESSPVFMQDVPKIDSVYFEVNQRTRFDEELILTEDWLDILVDSKNTSNYTKYWKWDFEETWEIRIPTDSIPIQHPDPEDDDKVYFTTEKVNIDPDKEVCWVSMPSRSIVIKSTDNNPTNEIKRMVINSIGPNEDKLHIKYSILVKQTALNKESYQFWERLREANEEVGSIYDKTPSQIFGNIRCCNGKDKALPLLDAHIDYCTEAVIKKTPTIYINNYEMPEGFYAGDIPYFLESI
ncbi:hypothetical protein MNBD_BACTEROID01-1867 [hydrothermal vent metagenome]|uniref:DUF4249 domain-containing protein n=1 Tax=hydrothermal vent metagenome TaxID=652676 RepID=A0A3B0UTZ0_9ZZZZ